MPAHTNTVEHEQYVLAGRATIGIGTETREVGRGDIVYIAAGTPHWYQAHAGEAIRVSLRGAQPPGYDRARRLLTGWPALRVASLSSVRRRG